MQAYVKNGCQTNKIGFFFYYEYKKVVFDSLDEWNITIIFYRILNKKKTVMSQRNIDIFMPLMTASYLELFSADT